MNRKVSKVMLGVLEKMALGRFIQYQRGNRYAIGLDEQVKPETVGALRRRGLIVRNGVGPGDYPRYHITDTGRSLVEQTKEVEGK